MTSPLAAVAFAAMAAAALPARAQESTDGARNDGVESVERRTWKLLREKGPSVLSVRVVTHAVTQPRLVLPGVTIAPPGGATERVDASGFLVDANGFVVTTAAAVRDAALVEVRFSDGTVRDADIVGVDAPFRIAVLRTRAPDGATPLSVPDRGTHADMCIAWFFQAAGGRPDVQLARVRAADSRDAAYDRYLYTTQPLLEGAAGGPLLRGDGRLMGMAVGEVRRPATPGDDTSPVTLATLFVRGDDIHRAVRDIVRTGRVNRPMLGIVLDRDTNRIDQLVPGGPAERAGLIEGDHVLAIAGARVDSLTDITRALLRRRIGEPVTLAVDHHGAKVQRLVHLSSMALPPLPSVAPFPGAELRLSAEVGPDGDRTVTFVSVRPNSTLYTAGVRAGDRLMTVDGRSALRFLARHRIHPADARPQTLTIERSDEHHVIPLGGTAATNTLERN